jgi:hypothetical protein
LREEQQFMAKTRKEKMIRCDEERATKVKPSKLA